MRHATPYSIKTFLMILFFCTGLYSTYSQVKDRNAQPQTDKTVDSLVLKLGNSTSEIDRMSIKLDLAKYLGTFEIEEGRDYLNDVRAQLSDSNEDNEAFSKLRGKLFHVISVYETAESNFSAALENIQKAIDIRKEIGDSVGLGNSYFQRAYLYDVKEDTLKAKEYYLKSLAILKNFDKKKAISDVYLSLGVIASRSSKKDSALYYYNKAKEIDTSISTISQVNGNIGALYLKEGQYEKAITLYQENIPLYKKIKDHHITSMAFQSMAVAYALNKDYEQSGVAIDSAITYMKAFGDKRQLVRQYYTKRNIYSRAQNYKEAYEAAKLYKIYSDSLNDIEEIKRFTELELTYEFDKEKELTAQQLEDERNMKKLYIIFFIAAIIAGISILYLVKKNNKQKLDLAEMDVLKADLALVNREKELKQILVETSVRKSVLKETLDQVKKIIDIKDEARRQSALKSLSALLLSDNSLDTAASVLETYLDEVSVDFKVLLDMNYPSLSPKEKELLCLMKMGLSSTEISKLLRTTNVAIKSSRYRIRKKLQIDANQDIIQYLEDKALNS